MTKNTKENQEDIGDVPSSPLIIHRQFLKDLSFENPNAPKILQRTENKPQMDINIGLDVQKQDHEEFQDYYEVLLTLSANAVRNDEAMFLAEVVYGAAVSVNGLEEKQHHPLLFIEVPKMIFPFARQIMSNITQSGGFMPLQLTPVDFRAMYIRRFADDAEDGAQEND